MASSQLYTRALVTINGKLLTEETSVTVKRDTKAQEVDTVAKGFAGFSPGAFVTTIDVESAVPSADFELNPGPFMLSLQVVEIGIITDGAQLICTGFIINDNFQHAVNSESKLSFSFVGVPADWQ